MKLFDSKISIRTRLIVLIVSAIVFTHILLGAVFQYAIRHHFLKQDYQHVSVKVENAFNRSTHRIMNKDMLEHFDLNNLNVWLIKNSQQSYSNSNIKIPDEALSYFLKNKDVGRPFSWTVGNDSYRAFSFSAGKGNMLVAGVIINHHLDFYRDINVMVFIFFIMTGLLTILYGVFSVKNSLRPLKIFANHLGKVKPGHLNIRIPIEKLPIELAELALVQNEMLDRLDDGFQRLGEFSSDIAHELRTPLSNISTQTQVILSKERSITEYEDVLISNLEELERINKTINDILYLAKSENSLLYHDNKCLDLAEEISQVIEYISIVGEDKNIDIYLSGDGELHFDRSMLQRVMNNLLSNAVRHAYSDSTINVDIKEHGGAIKISVENTGKTIPAESLPFIFNRFYRADKSREHHNSVGAGLGLAIVRSIIKAYQGRITATSQNGVTVFTIDIPNT